MCVSTVSTRGPVTERKVTLYVAPDASFVFVLASQHTCSLTSFGPDSEDELDWGLAHLSQMFSPILVLIPYNRPVLKIC